MRIFAFVGRSQTGKTQLISRLIPKLKERGHSVAVIKHTPNGFDLDVKGKDSWQFLEAGSEQVGIFAPDKALLFQKTDEKTDIRTFARQYFQDVDIVFVEGGRQFADIQKIEILREGVSKKLESSKEELVAVISDFDVDVNKPVFHPDKIKEIVDFLMSDLDYRKPPVILCLDGVRIPLNEFVQEIFQNIVSGMIESLKGIKKDPDHITLIIERTNVKNEKAG